MLQREKSCNNLPSLTSLSLQPVRIEADALLLHWEVVRNKPAFRVTLIRYNVKTELVDCELSNKKETMDLRYIFITDVYVLVTL